MKKSLLIAALASLAMPAFAVTDGVTYQDKGNYTMTNLWVNASGAGAWNSLVANGTIVAQDKVASAVPMGDKIYVASTAKKGVNDEGAAVVKDEGQLFVFDYNTGEYIKTIELTLDGAPYSGTLCANFIDKDDFGHVYIYGTTFTPLSSEGVATGLKIYTIDLETGALTLQVAPEIDDASKSGRTDFCDVSGDITRQQAACTVMAIPGGSDVPMYAYAWYYEQGSNEPYGNFAGDYSSTEIEESYPENGTWGQCAQVTIITDEDFGGAQFYIDGNATKPAIYDNQGSLCSSFADVVEADQDNMVLTPIDAPCGAYEFTFDNGDSFLAYAKEEHTFAKGEANRIVIAKYGEIGEFGTLEHYYTVPENTVMTDGISNAYGGRRLHVVHTTMNTDAAGKQAAEILTYKSGHGMALYRMAEKGYNAGITAPVVDNNAAVEYFNLQGIRVDNPANGIFIRRQGTEVSKVAL